MRVLPGRPQVRLGSVWLARGWHPLTLTFFEHAGGAVLIVTVLLPQDQKHRHSSREGAWMRFLKSDANKDKRLTKTVRLRGHVVATFFVAAGGRPSRLTDNHRARRNLLMSSVTLVSSLRTLIQTTMVRSVS